MAPSAPGLLEHLLSRIKTADGVFAVGEDQRIVHWGPTAEYILGHPAEAVMDHPCQDIIGGRDARNLRFCRRNCPIMRNARKGRPMRDYDLLVQARDGSSQWLNISVLVVHDEDRHTTSVVHLFRDVTRRRRLEEQARHAMTTLRELVSEEKRQEDLDQDPCPLPAPELTPRELEALRLLVMGLSTGQIAESLGISPITARNHLTNLQGKLGAKTRLQSVLYASHHHLI